ncbi:MULTISPECIES: LysE family translocator [unclassified Burkholderia]|uniref:LysE family translocator n=1 Tax=unclassified Burkholderia TaxID=2613784 RepID=UPI000F596B6E|nr:MULTISPECIES: LysE family translocator [unclassified Burkholderia]RQR33732.1 LysE family translocator [Burkholderia sp. Bp9131]RQR65792.1 LysE family translocator [Burkholderia sp. Bp9015]RQR92887.1 LysE family translocator [Burkholderia sp. Bp8994]RQS20864.1 LysE family translocator [Burkholderia sp. Bp8995]RQS37605.1 LysE family translocator [Burkholderia sp. Bp8990]
MSIQTWLLFAAAYLATTLSPGPNVLLVIRNTVRYGSRGTAATIAGNLVAQGAVVMLVAFGVGAVLAEMPPLFIAMKVVGAAYLIYLGIRQLRGGRNPRSPDGKAAIVEPDRRKLFREALFVSGSNPKTMIFLSAFMPQFIAHDRPLAMQFVAMYATIACTVVIVHSVYSFGVRRLHRGIGISPWVRAAKRASGLLFVGLGIKLLTARQA